MALVLGPQKLCCRYHCDSLVDAHHPGPISCFLQIHVAPMSQSIQTAQSFTVSRSTRKKTISFPLDQSAYIKTLMSQMNSKLEQKRAIQKKSYEE